MNILIIYRGNYPVHTASSKRLENYVKALRLEKHNVIVQPIYILHKSKYLELLLSFFLPTKAFLSVITKAKHYSAVYIYGPGWVFKFSIALAAKFRGKPVGTELNEKPYSIHGNGRRDLILRRFEIFHELCLIKFVYPLVDGFIVISSPLAKYVREKGKKAVIIWKVPILVDYDYYQERFESHEYKIPYIINTAALNDHKDGIVKVFEAFAYVISQGYNLHFYLTSKVAAKETLANVNLIIKKNKLTDKVTFIGDLDEPTLLSYQSHCSMVILNKVDSEQNRYNFATKLGEYLALGKPVITTSIGEVSNYLIENESCIFIEPNNAKMIAQAMIKLFTDEELARNLGENGRKIAEEVFNIRKQSKSIEKFFYTLIDIRHSQSKIPVDNI
jgi:glycosyltransferase involved in cell wall biosynthesis